MKCWPKSLRKERASIYAHLLACARASKGGSGAGAGALAALTPGQAAAAKVWVLLRKSPAADGSGEDRI